MTLSFCTWKEEDQDRGSLSLRQTHLTAKSDSRVGGEIKSKDEVGWSEAGERSSTSGRFEGPSLVNPEGEKLGSLAIKL